MTPDEIRDFMVQEFPQFFVKPRHEPGWSFHLPGQGTGVRRIIRATRKSNEAGTQLLLSISNRLGHEGSLIDFDNGTKEQLRQIVEGQLKLFQDHFSQ